MKRVADEAITKEHGATPNTDAVQSQSKQMATAAQRAARKIAPLRKSRAGQGSRATTPTGPSVFDQPQQSSFSVPSTGFQFGSNTASSFPPPSQSSFDFGNGQSSATSFTFGQSSTNAQQSTNPFANMNGATGGAPQQDNSMMMDSPQKSAFSGSLFQFGNSAPTNTLNSASTNGFSFGQSTQEQKPAGSFGNNLFGQQKQSQDPISNMNPFASTSQQAQQNGITSTTGLFGQTSQPATSAPSSTPLFAGFGAPPTATSAPSSQSEPVFKFGSTSSTQTPSSQPETPAPFSGFSFGQPAVETEPTAQKPLFSFGQTAAAPSTNTAPTTSQPSSTSVFAPQKSSVTSSAPHANLFGAVAKPADQQRQEKPASSDVSEDEPSGPKNPFASLFGAQSTSITSTEASKPVSSPFKFGGAPAFTPPQAPAEPTPKSVEPATQSLSTSPPKSLFSFGQATTSSDGAFSSKSPAAPATAPTSNLFNLNRSTSSTEITEKTAKVVTNPGPSANVAPSFFGKAAQPQQSLPSEPLEPSEPFSKANSNPFGGFGQQSATKRPESTSTEEEPVSKKRTLFHSSTPSAMEQTAFGSFPNNTSSASHTPKPYKASTTQGPPTRKEPTTRPVSTEGAPQIPRHLSGDKYKSYDENYRLRNLNRLFKDKISALDTDRFDVMNFIQNYLDHREAIGEGLGRYGRAKAGLKRKATDSDDLDSNEDTHGKKSKVASAPQPIAEKAQATSAPSASNAVDLFSSFTSPKPSSTVSPLKPTSDSQTSSLFRSMIPSASSTAQNPSNMFSTATAKSTTPPSSPPKATAPQMPKFEVPKFGAGGDFMAAFAKSSAESAKKFAEAAKEKRKAEEYDSEEEDEETWNKKYEEEQRAQKAKIQEAAQSGFKPTFGTAPSQPAFTFGQPNTTAAGVKPTQLFGAISSDMRGSSQDPVDTIESAGETADENEGSGSGNSGDDEEEPVTDDLLEDEADGDNQEENEEEEEEEEEGEPIPQLDPKESLFSRITSDKPKDPSRNDQPVLQPAANNSFKPGLMFGSIGKSTPDAPTFSPLTPATASLPKGDFVPATTFNFTPTPSSAPAKPWGTSSVLSGGALREGPIPGEGLFGSRPSTPQPLSDTDGRSTSVFGSSLNGPSDNTWKRGSEIKFGTSPLKGDSTAPAVEVTSATPPPKDPSKPFAGLFGQTADKPAFTNGSSNSLGFNFSSGLHNAAMNTPAPGFLSATSHLGNIPGSGLSSRATSPGLTDNESVASDNTEDYSNEPQAPSLMNTNAGEEDEDVLYETKSNIYRMYLEKDLVALDAAKEKGIGRGREKMKAGMNLKGAGTVKLLKHKESNKCRILFRADPGANIILNVRLIPTVDYKSGPSGKTNGSVTFLAVGEDGKMQSWVLKTKTKETSDELAELMNENKNN